jgi:lysophospholipase L1-like esterase
MLGVGAPAVQRKFVDAAGPAGIATLVAEGDSWFNYPGKDVLGALHDLGYDIEHVAKPGDLIESMAYLPGELAEFARVLEKLARREIRPKAVLLSGGGNDVAGDQFHMLLDHVASKKPGLNEDVVRGVIDVRVRNAYDSIIKAITKLCHDIIDDKIPIPILLHGYGNPVPDGRGFLGGALFLPGPWLRPGFHQKGFKNQDANTDTMEVLIGRFNTMLATVADGFKHVHYVDVRGALQNGPNYRQWWANELHPKDRGFDAVAKIIADELAALGPI